MRNAERLYPKSNPALLVLALSVTCSACVSTPPSVGNDNPVRVADENGLVPEESVQELRETVARPAPDPLEFEALFDTVAALSDSPLYKNSSAELLIDGPATYDHMLRAIGAAKHFIWLETYIFADDRVGRQFAESLARKSRQGIDVRVIYDSIGSLSSDDEFFEQMESAGLKLVEFHNINPVDGGNPLNANVRDHRKILIVDGEVAYTGGINLSSTYSSSSSGPIDPDDRLTDGWRDTHVAIRGPAVEGFETLFIANWNENNGDESRLTAIGSKQVASGDDVIAVLGSEGGDGKQSEIFHAYREAMRVARDRIWITQAYFAPDDEFMDSLKSAAERNVDVRVLVPGVADSVLVFNASRSRYDELLASGVKIYESQSSFVHAKTAVIDGLWSTVGSSNLDARSFLHNDEINAIVFGRDLASQLEEQFVEDLGHSRRIRLDEWRDRGIRQRFLEWVSWPLEYWL